jgi:hypothetical protein
VLSERYPTSLFSIPRPKYSRSSNLSADLEKILGTTQAGRLPEEQVLKKLQLEKRGPVKHLSGYFESAALVGAVTLVTPVVLVLGALAWSRGRTLLISFK